MRKTYVKQQPQQPRHPSLRFAEKPPLKPIPVITGVDEQGEPYTLILEEHPLIKVAPRVTIPNINLETLQIWLNHLGPAIYNPITSVQTSDGEFHSTRDGNHRTRCLWEIGEPLIRVYVRKSNNLSLCCGQQSAWRKWLRTYKHLNDHPTTTPYMFGEPRKYWKRVMNRYYPPLWQPGKVLAEWFKETRNDAPYFKDKLYSDWSFKQIYRQWKQTSYRFNIIYAIKNYVNIEDKTVLDVGSFYGWASFLLYEDGAKECTALDKMRRRVQVIKHIASVRRLKICIVFDKIQNYVKGMPKFNIVLLLNVFHHILAQGEGWEVLNKLLDNCDVMFLMMGAKPNWHILDEWDNDIPYAIESNVENVKVTPLLKTQYRNRVLYVLEKND